MHSLLRQCKLEGKEVTQNFLGQNDKAHTHANVFLGIDIFFYEYCYVGKGVNTFRKASETLEDRRPYQMLNHIPKHLEGKQQNALWYQHPQDCVYELREFALFVLIKNIYFLKKECVGGSQKSRTRRESWSQEPKKSCGSAHLKRVPCSGETLQARKLRAPQW